MFLLQLQTERCKGQSDNYICHAGQYIEYTVTQKNVPRVVGYNFVKSYPVVIFIARKPMKFAHIFYHTLGLLLHYLEKLFKLKV